MRFTLSALAVALAAALGAHAVDNRLLYNLPADVDPQTFTVSFGNACASWAPAIEAGLTFQSFQVQPGDFQGNNADTQAKIFCTWNHDGDTSFPSQVSFTADVAESVGATPA
ncbi:Glycoside hydrolase family 81 protein [Mycena kentingensis (nom. inval.)]|nr:Glycoside hydrolase family 81 protein [Mycena kentingensis (nom. inval.)]